MLLRTLRSFAPLRITAVIACALSCTRAPERPAHVYPNAPVVLISIDTLRSDHLPAYGYRGVETPHLDRLRKDAILYRTAYSHCPMTLPSHLSMLTGLLPPEHGVRDNVGFRFDATRHETLQALLRANGYATGAAVSSYVLRRETGIADSFDFYDDALDVHPGSKFIDYQRSGFATEPVAERWIGEHATKPFFFFLHLYEPHVPYAPPEPFSSRYANRYDGEIAAADAIVGKLLDHLRALGLYDKALIIVTSDHGEGLGDHGEKQHSILLYREAIQVPLFVKLPGNALAGRSVEAPAQLIDLFPTVAALTGVTPRDAHAGKSLVALADSTEHPRRVYSESQYARLHFGWSSLRSVADGRLHLIESAKRNEMYDLAKDAAEQQDLAPQRRRDVASLRDVLGGVPAIDALPSNVDPQEAAKLAALGYVGSVRNHPEATVDPRERIGIVEELQSAMARPPLEAAAAMRAVAEAHPEMVEVWLQLGDLLVSQGRFAEAVQAYRSAMQHSTALSVEALLGLSEAFLQQNDAGDATKAAELALAAAPREAHLALARIALAKNDLESAEQHATAAAGNEPQPTDLVLLADIAARRGAFAQALDLLARAEKRARASGIANVYRLESVRADVLARGGKPVEAIAAYERELAAFPGDLRAYTNLAVLYFVSGDAAASETTLTRMTSANPSPAARQLAAKTRAALR
jgi:choline-sulfatase